MTSDKRRLHEGFRNAASNLLLENDETEASDPLGELKEKKGDPVRFDGLSEDEMFIEDPTIVVQEMGDHIASQTWSGGSWSDVYEYKGLFWAQDEVDFVEFDNPLDAFSRAGIGNDDFDNINSQHIARKYEYLIKQAK